jgi:hypothetical protein
MRRLALVTAALALVAGVGVAVFVAAPSSADDAPTGPAPKQTAATDARWTDTATRYRDRVDDVITVHCPPGGAPGVVWGTDVYTDDSSVCTAAVHAGRITLSGGGTVRIQIGPGKESFQGTIRNGVTSSDYGAWGGSFTFVR